MKSKSTPCRRAHFIVFFLLHVGLLSSINQHVSSIWMLAHQGGAYFSLFTYWYE